MLENRSSRLKKLHFRSWHRGCKETDLLFGPFADTGLYALSPAQLDTYEMLLEEHDADVWGWVTGKFPPPEDGRYNEMLKLLQDCRDGENSALSIARKE